VYELRDLGKQEARMQALKKLQNKCRGYTKKSKANCRKVATNTGRGQI